MDYLKMCSQGFEENTMALLDSSGIKDSQDIHDDRIAFLEAVRSISLDCNSNRPPSWNMYDATFKMLRDSKSLELVMASFQLLTELNKVTLEFVSSEISQTLHDFMENPNRIGTGHVGHAKVEISQRIRTRNFGHIIKFPRTYLVNTVQPDIFVNSEAWSPFVLGTDSIRMEGQDRKSTSDLLDPFGFACLVEAIAQDVNVYSVLGIEKMLLFQYVVEVLETDIRPRQTLYKESPNWILFRESMLNMLLGSRKIHHKSLMKNCMAIMLRRCCHQVLEEDCKMSTDEFNVPLAAALAETQRRTFGAMKKFLTLVMDLDFVRKEADSLGATSRNDGSRSSALEIILDELTYNIHDLSPFLMAFSVPKWKLEIILQYLSKYCIKASVRTRRANVPNEITVDYILTNFSTPANSKAIGKKISSGILQMLLAHLFQACLLTWQDSNSCDSPKKIGGTLAEISEKFIFTIQNLRKTEEGIEMMPLVREALFTATLLAGKMEKDDMQI